MGYTTHPSLLKRISEGGDAAWEEFFVRYAPFIRSIGRGGEKGKVFLREDETEELLQETMCSLFRNDTINRYDPAKGRFHSYLSNIVERNAIDIIRKRKPHESIDGIEPESSAFQELFDAEYQHYIVNVLLDELKRIVSPENFQIFQYSQLQGHSPQETAAAFEIPVARVYTIKKRCIEHLQNIVKENNLAEKGFPW